MRTILLNFIIILSSFFLFAYPQPLSFYKTTDHFTFFCEPIDSQAGDRLIEESEFFFQKISHDLAHHYNSHITIKMYHDLDHFYSDENNNTNDNQSDKNTLIIINPYHTHANLPEEMVIKANNVSIAELFINDKYSTTQVPELLRQGLALYLADYFPKTFLEKIKNSLKYLPSLEELEKSNQEENNSIDAFIAQFIAPYLFIEFIDTQWNRETLLNLLNNYLDFENILHFLKKDVEKHWHYSTLFKTYGFESGDHSISLFMNDLFHTFEKALNAPQKHNQSFNTEIIEQNFNTYKKKLEESNNHILTLIQTNRTVVGWALFSSQSPQNVTLEAICIHPDYQKQDMSKKLINAVHQKFRTIKSIITVNKNMNIKSSYFCGTIEC